MSRPNPCCACGTRSKKISYQQVDTTQLEGSVCDPCWDKYDGDIGRIAQVAKKKAKKKAKLQKMDPCPHCGQTEFTGGRGRGGHIAQCQKKGPKAAKKKAGKKRVGKKKRTRKAVGKASRSKGGRYENAIKKVLARWHGEPDDVVGTKNSAFQKTPGSGGVSPVNWPLDIYVPADFPWAVECKNRETTNDGMEAMERFLNKGEYQVVAWFREAEEELVAAAIRRPLLLVFTRNNYPDFAAFRRPLAYKDNTRTARVFWSVPWDHMTLCSKRAGEIVVCHLDWMTTMGTPTWRQLYGNPSVIPESYLPRKWND
jgi:hypothetical protein